MQLRIQAILMLVFTLGCWFDSFGQSDRKLDSLLVVLASAKEDTSKVKLLNTICGRLVNKSRYTEASAYAEEAIELGKKLSYKKGHADANIHMGNAREKQGDYKEALKHQKIALSMYEELNNKHGMSLCYLNIGNLNFRLNNTSEALVNFNVCLKLSEELDNKGTIADAQGGLGMIHERTGKLEEAINNYLFSAQLSNEIGHKLTAANAYANVSNIYFRQGNYALALENLFTSVAIRLEIGEKHGLAGCYASIANIYSDQGKYPEALEQSEKALAISSEIGDKDGIARAYTCIGNIHERKGDYPMAMKSQLNALKILEGTGNRSRIANSYSSIGTLHWNQENYSEALKHYQESLSISEEIGDRRNMAYQYNNIASVLEIEGRHAETLKYLLSALEIFNEFGDQYAISFIHNSLGAWYQNADSLEVALKHFKRSLETSENIGLQEGITIGRNSMGIICGKLGRYDEAREYLESGLAIALETGTEEWIRNSYQNLSTLDSLTGNIPGAYRNYQLYIAYRDSLFNEENTKKLVQTQLQYEFDKKEDSLRYRHALTDERLFQQTLLNKHQLQALLLREQELDLAQKEKALQQLEIEKGQSDNLAHTAEIARKQKELALLNKDREIKSLEIRKQKLTKNYLIAGLALFGLLTLFLYMNYITRQRLKLQTLRNKIASDLHDDVGSTLSSISIFAQIAQQQSKETIPMLETIEESSLKMLDAMADIVWTINPENDDFEKIVDRMKSFAYELLGAKKIDFEFEADMHVQQLKLPMDVRKNLYLIFKEATNNMAKYADANKAHFVVKRDNDKLTMMIRDNGKGFDTDQLSTGNGLRNMKKRAEEIGGTLKIVSRRDEGTVVTMSVAV